MRGNFKCDARRLQVYVTLTVLRIETMVSAKDSVRGQSAALNWLLKGSKKLMHPVQNSFNPLRTESKFCNDAVLTED